MTAARELAAAWTCDRCSVAVGRIDGEPVPIPDSWGRSPSGIFCLQCRRERAAEAAIAAAPDDCPKQDRAKLRRIGMIEFELLRAPDESNRAIAKACRSSVIAVADVRRKLRIPTPPQGQRETA